MRRNFILSEHSPQQTSRKYPRRLLDPVRPHDVVELCVAPRSSTTRAEDEVMTPRQRRSSAVDRSTIAFLCGLCGVEELPGSFLIEVFGALGMSISGARSYLARAVADGRLASHRHGRQTLYSLNGILLRRYRTVRRGFDGRPSWNGHFHIAIYNIPEARRPERDALRAAAFDEGWASPRPGVLLGIQPPGIWADRTDCSTGRLDVDLGTARDLAARAWPLEEAAQQIRHLASRLEDIKARYRDLDTSDTSRPALLTRVVATHEILSNTTYLWGMLPNLPMELFPEDYPHDVLARITAEMEGPIMVSGEQAAARLLADHQSP